MKRSSFDYFCPDEEIVEEIVLPSEKKEIAYIFLFLTLALCAGVVINVAKC